LAFEGERRERDATPKRPESLSHLQKGKEKEGERRRRRRRTIAMNSLASRDERKEE